jgi:hypothetical protein
MIDINPFCFNLPLFGPEEYLFRLLKGNYEKADKVVRGRPDQLIEAALVNTEECKFDRSELETALTKLLENPQPLIYVDVDGMIAPTRHFVVTEPA